MAMTTDYGTYAWAAEQLDVSLRQVGRYVNDGLLSVVVPRCGARESRRHKRMLAVSEVLELKTVRARMKSGAVKTVDRSDELEG